MSAVFDSPDTLTQALAGTGYIVDDELATAVYLAATLERPILIEGPAGVGKTAVAAAISQAMGWLQYSYLMRIRLCQASTR